MFYFCLSRMKKRTMRDLSSISAPVAEDLQRFEEAFVQSFSEGTASMEDVFEYVRDSKGKRLRPMMVFLAARLFADPNEATLRTALFVETVHTATLIHDDVVDNSAERRGKPSMHVRWDAPTAVLMGDYLLSKAMMLLTGPDDLPVLREMLTTALSMSEGELMQQKQKREGYRQEDYLEIVTRKTALLFQSCCSGGALSVHADGDAVRRVADFGRNLGVVFQLRDDMLDADVAEEKTLAETLLPQYLERGYAALDALAPLTPNKDVLETLRELLSFCATRLS